MGRQARGKKPEKLGTGKVTPVQVAFIVDRYLAENHYTKALAEFRSEAASVLGVAQPRQVPKSMLSLADILDDYITLKEQRITLGQEKARMDQLLLGMQDIIYAYQSGGMLPGSISTQFSGASSSALPSPQAEVTTPMSAPYAIPPTSAATNVVVATRSALPVPNNKRKSSSPMTDTSSLSAKKACPPVSQSVNSSISTERVSQGYQMSANIFHRPSQVGRPSSHTSTPSQARLGNSQPNSASSSPLLMPTPQNDSSSMSIKTSHNHPSPAAPSQGWHQSLQTTTQMPNDYSSCPQTPPQAFCIQAATPSASPTEGSYPMTTNAALSGSVGIPAIAASSSVQMQNNILDGQVANLDNGIARNGNASISTENSFDSSTAFVTPSKDKNSGRSLSPSKLIPRKVGKRGNIKSRLDFNSSAATSTRSPIKSNPKETPTDLSSTCHTSYGNDEMDVGQFDLVDIPPMDADFEKFMSDFLVDFQFGSEELACPDAVALMDQTAEISMAFDEIQTSTNANQSPVKPDSPIPRGMGILAKKDMNIQVPASLKPNDAARSITMQSSLISKGGKFKDVADQENVPIL